MTWRRRALAIAGVVLPLAAAPAAAGPPVALTSDELAAVLLTPEDVPDAGWGPATAGVEFPPAIQESVDGRGWCNGPSDGLIAAEGPVTGSAVTTIEHPPVRRPAPSVSGTSTVWEALWSFDASAARTATEEAKAFLARIRAAATDCKEWVWLQEENETFFDVTPRVIRFPKVADQRLAVRVRAVPEDSSATVDLVVYVRVANHVVVLKGAFLPRDDALFTKIVKRAVTQLEETVAAAG